MILKHPNESKCIRIARWKQLEILRLKQAGWIEQPDYERTQAQKNQSLRWQQQGQAKRLAACLRSYINNNAYTSGMFTPEELNQLQYAVTILDRGASRI